MKLVPLLSVSVVIAISQLHSGEIQSADQLISGLEQIQKSAAEPAEEAAEKWNQKIEAFGLSAATLGPEEAAQGWLELYQQWRDNAPATRRTYPSADSGNFLSLVKALPPPQAWEILGEKLPAESSQEEARSEIMTLFAATLNGDSGGQWKAFDALADLSSRPPSASPFLSAISKVLGGSGNAGMMVNGLVLQLAQPMESLSDNPEDLLKALNLRLQATAKTDRGYRYPLTLPDLVGYVGEEKAKEFLTAAIRSGLSLRVSGKRTAELARTLALQNLDALKVPLWDLVVGTGAQNIKLYDALAEKFPISGENESERDQASRYYLLSLILSGQTEQADAWLSDPKKVQNVSLPSRYSNPLSPSETKKLTDYLFHILAIQPNLPFWGDLIHLAAREGRADEALALARKIVAEGKLDSANQEQVRGLLITAALADGSIEEAVGLIRKQVAKPNPPNPSDPQDGLSWALKLAKLGSVLQREDLRDEGIREALACVSQPPANRQINDELLDLLVQVGRSSEAQALIIETMKVRLAENPDPRMALMRFQNELLDLAGIYDASGRQADLLDLLVQAPWWGETTLGDICLQKDFRRISLGEMAARAWLADGDKVKAVAVLKQTLRLSGSDDRVYQLLVEIEGQDALPFLDELFSRNQFEERPLIWKAIVEFEAGKTDEAEATIRKAISIDPSDGEMGPGDRMRAYAVLADILEKQGQTEDAKIYRGAVTAIRLSEEADTYKRVGLLSQALAMYEKALTHFADAYCIQSRLAVQLADLGDMKQAEVHYQRAFELMPDSFGRMESHCFGCERAFKGEVAESLAEKTFQTMLESQPDNPRLHYLMGYLRMEQKRYDEALANFQKAVALDPEYINAWRKILSMGSHLLLPNQVRNEAILAIQALNPSRSESALRNVTDLKALWTVVEDLRQRFPEEKVDPLLVLEATADQIAAFENQNPRHWHNQFSIPKEELGLRPPGTLISEQILVQAIANTLIQLQTLGL